MRRLPLEDPPEQVPRPHPPAAATMAAATILLADDDDSFRRPLRRVFEEEGYAVLEAANGVETIELLAAAADGHGPVPDVLVLDVCMPGYSGLGVLKALRRFRERPRAIVVTGFDEASVRVFAERLGAFQVLRKPVDLDQLLAEVLAAAKRPR